MSRVSANGRAVDLPVELVSGHYAEDGMLPQFANGTIVKSPAECNVEIPTSWAAPMSAAMRDLVEEIKTYHRSKSDMYISHPRYWERS